MDLCIKMLWMANKASWGAVYNYVMDPLYETEEDDRKWKLAVREAKEDAESRSKAQAARKGSGQSYGNRDSFKKPNNGGKKAGIHVPRKVCRLGEGK